MIHEYQLNNADGKQHNTTFITHFPFFKNELPKMGFASQLVGAESYNTKQLIKQFNTQSETLINRVTRIQEKAGVIKTPMTPNTKQSNT